MKIIEHEKSSKPEEMTLSFNPMIVWFTRNLEIHIEKGDTLKEVSRIIAKYWEFQKPEADGIAAYYFAIGERRATKKKPGNWTEAELSKDPKRRYLC